MSNISSTASDVDGQRALGRESSTRRPARSPPRRAWPRRPRSTAPSQAAKALPRLGGNPAADAAPASCSNSRSCLNATPGNLAADHHRGARQGLLRRAGRDHPRPRSRRIRLRHPASGEGRVHRAGRARHRRLVDAPAARGLRRHHAVQFPGDGAAVDVPDRARLRQLLHPEAVRERPVGRLRIAELLLEAGLPAGRLQRRQRRQGRRSTRSSASGHRGGQLCRLDPDREYIYATGARRTASGCRRWAARRTTWSSCPTPISTRPPTR